MLSIADRLVALRASRRQTLRAFGGLTEAQLELPAAWRGRQASVRFLLLRLSEAGDERRVALAITLDVLGWRQQEAARILALRRGLVEGLLVGLPDELLHQTPSAGEWSAGQVLEHLRAVAERYLIQSAFAAERLRAAEMPIRVPDTRLPPLVSVPVAAPTVDEALTRMQAIWDTIAARLSLLDDPELAAPTVWAGWTIDLRFRLHRFAAHERQHAVQVAKTLQAIGWRRSEAQMILGLAEESRVALEGTLLGCPDELATLAPAGLPSIGALLDQALADEDGTRAIVAEVVGEG